MKVVEVLFDFQDVRADINVNLVVPDQRFGSHYHAGVLFLYYIFYYAFYPKDEHTTPKPMLDCIHVLIRCKDIPSEEVLDDENR